MRHHHDLPQKETLDRYTVPSSVFTESGCSNPRSHLSPPHQGHGGADRLGSSAAGSLRHIWGPVVTGCSTVGPGPAGLGGPERGHAVETGLHAESRPRPGHAAPEFGPQRQDADGTVPQSPAPGAGDGGHLQRFHPVSELMFTHVHLTQSRNANVHFLWCYQRHCYLLS